MGSDHVMIVWQAVLTAISNRALQFAIFQGTIVTFWRKAVQGTTLGDLHRDWVSLEIAVSPAYKWADISQNFGMYTHKALTAGRSFNLLCLACLAATLVVMDGR
jgi:hypothetical protein